MDRKKAVERFSQVREAAPATGLTAGFATQPPAKKKKWSIGRGGQVVDTTRSLPTAAPALPPGPLIPGGVRKRTASPSLAPWKEAIRKKQTRALVQEEMKAGVSASRLPNAPSLKAAATAWEEAQKKEEGISATPLGTPKVTPAASLTAPPSLPHRLMAVHCKEVTNRVVLPANLRDVLIELQPPPYYLKLRFQTATQVRTTH
eukprot:Sspe_Gene.97193::Locus_70823_Transcript_1_1_Confidence_1.000_Length_677::g.97193::m.97193